VKIIKKQHFSDLTIYEEKLVSGHFSGNEKA